MFCATVHLRLNCWCCSQCRSCGSKETDYYQKQTRSADEPMTTYVPPCSLRFSRCLTYLLSHTRDIHVQLPHLPGMRSTRPFLRLSSAFGHGRGVMAKFYMRNLHHIIAGCPNHHQISPKKSPDKRGVSHAVGDGSAAERLCRSSTSPRTRASSTWCG